MEGIPEAPHVPQAAARACSGVLSKGFSLVELLVVMAIIGVMAGLSVLALQGMKAPAVQMAAEQVMSGLSLARQVAISKNTKAAFLIANASGNGFPQEPYRYWAVVCSNKGAGDWSFAKPWEKMPDGAFILETRGQSGAAYSPIGGNPLGGDYAAGAVAPDKFDEDDFTISGSAIVGQSIPNITFSSDGSSSSAARAIRVVAGTVVGGNATLTSTTQYYFVETDPSIGRIRLRAPDSYRTP
jgi:prepilin-type N-terminal cleavage/methylation domain-containing protein